MERLPDACYDTCTLRHTHRHTFTQTGANVPAFTNTQILGHTKTNTLGHTQIHKHKRAGIYKPTNTWTRMNTKQMYLELISVSIMKILHSGTLNPHTHTQTFIDKAQRLTNLSTLAHIIDMLFFISIFHDSVPIFEI